MSLQIASNLFSKCIQTNVSALASLSGFSTQIGNSSRGYIRDFWKKPTAMPTPGHLHLAKTLDGHNKRLYVSSKNVFISNWVLLKNVENSILLAIDKFLFFRSKYLEKVVMVKAINLGDQVIIALWRRVVMMQKWSTRLDGNLSCGIWFEEKANTQSTSNKIHKNYIVIVMSKTLTKWHKNTNIPIIHIRKLYYEHGCSATVIRNYSSDYYCCGCSSLYHSFYFCKAANTTVCIAQSKGTSYEYRPW